jgi:hypothetical protein
MMGKSGTVHALRSRGVTLDDCIVRRELSPAGPGVNVGRPRMAVVFQGERSSVNRRSNAPRRMRQRGHMTRGPRLLRASAALPRLRFGTV